MSINFYPDREQLVKEIADCVSERKVDLLKSLCNGCVYNIFDQERAVSQCTTCAIQHGIASIMKTWSLSMAGDPDMDYLGVC